MIPSWSSMVVQTRRSKPVQLVSYVLPSLIR